MAETAHKATYYHTMVDNRPGEGARVLAALRDAGAKLLAFHAFPSEGRAQLDLVPADPAGFARLAKKAKVPLSPKKTVFLIVGKDKKGAGAALLDKLATAGVNVVAVDAVRTGSQFGALVWVAPDDLKKAAKVLGAK
jgi:hypothetical protein